MRMSWPRSKFARPAGCVLLLCLWAGMALQPVSAESGPFAGFDGHWSGTGTIKQSDKPAERIRCDAIALASPPAPLHDLASSVGATARWDGNGFPVETDADGRTAVPWLLAAGRAAGKPAVESGQAAGRAACR